jgi:hypothetical protein
VKGQGAGVVERAVELRLLALVRVHVVVVVEQENMQVEFFQLQLLGHQNL